MLVIVLVHQMLRAINPDWEHKKIETEEKNLENKAGYFDSLRNMKILHLAKMRLYD